MNLEKKVFGLVYVMIPLIYMLVYAIFTMIRGNELMTDIESILPFIALYYIFISVIGYLFFDKVRHSIKETQLKDPHLKNR